MSKNSIGSHILEGLIDAPKNLCLSKVFDDICHAYGADDVVYHAINVHGLTKNDAYLKLSYSDEWVSHYVQNDYFKIDPVVEEGTRSFIPFQWSSLDWRPKQRREFQEDASGHSIGTNGITIPIRGPNGQHALFSLSTSRSASAWNRQMQAQLGELHMLAHQLHQTVIQNEGVEPLEMIRLSGREREVLQWTAAGKTNDDIAEILDISERTVRVYLDTSRHKLGASNRTHAVARALGLGLIQPPD